MYVMRELAARLRPQLEGLVAAATVPAGQPFSPDSASAARRAIANRALGLLSTLEDPKVCLIAPGESYWSRSCCLMGPCSNHASHFHQAQPSLP